MGALSFFEPGLPVLRFPAWDCLPYDRISPSPGVAAGRMAALSQLAARKPAEGALLVVATLPAVLQRVPPREAIRQASYQARTGRDVNVADLERYFAVNGYVRASTVSERGEFAIRGGVIDVFAPGAEEPVRLDLFGDTLESIRAFDPETQRSTRQLHAIDLLPVSEALIDPDSIARFRKGYVAAFGAPGDDPLYATVSEGSRRAGMEHWLPLFYRRLETLLDYLGPKRPGRARQPGRGVAGRALGPGDRRLRGARRAGQGQGRRGLQAPWRPSDLYMDRAEWDARLWMTARCAASAPSGASLARGDGSSAPQLGRSLRAGAGAGQRQPVRGGAPSTPGARPGPASGCSSPHGRRARPTGWASMLADHGLKSASASPRTTGRRQGLGDPAPRASRPARGAAGGERLRDRRPGGDQRDRHPGRPAGAAAETPARLQLPGRGDLALAGRPGRPHRPRHRPLRGPQTLRGEPRRRTTAWT